MNSLLGSKIWYLVTICIDLVQNRPNSSWQTEYQSYLGGTPNFPSVFTKTKNEISIAEKMVASIDI